MFLPQTGNGFMSDFQNKAPELLQVLVLCQDQNPSDPFGSGRIVFILCLRVSDVPSAAKETCKFCRTRLTSTNLLVPLVLLLTGPTGTAGSASSCSAS